MSVRKIREEAGRFTAAARVLGSDVFKFVALRNARDSYCTALKVRTVGNAPVKARSRTTDAAVILSCFHDQYHLPPQPLPSESVIVDLGSNVGYTVRHLKYLYPQAKIIGVEMDPENYALCVENTQGLPDCHMVNAAVSESSGTVRYAKDKEEDAYYIVGARHSDSNAGKDLREVESLRIADLIARFHLQKIDYVKMDIEGAETGIFTSHDLSWLERVHMLNIEVHEKDFFDKIMRVLQSHGFRCWKDTRHWSLIMAVRGN